MATEMNSAEERSIIDELIRPAILKLVSESEGAYRCERDLHHHFTACLAQIANLGLGTTRRRVSMEHPALACYGSGRRGNLDCFFPSTSSGAFDCASRDGIAVELNYDYRDWFKVKKDMQKLIDPDSSYGQSLYFAYGKKRRFFDSVKTGIERAVDAFAEERPEFRLPVGLRVIVVEHLFTGGHVIHETCVVRACNPAELKWSETTMSGTDAHELRKETQLSSRGGKRTNLGTLERKVWAHWPSPSGRLFLAFVNQFGSCSLREFDSHDGRFLGIRREVGDFQVAFRQYFDEGRKLSLSRQPNLEVNCRPKLPDWVLVELQRQINKEAGYSAIRAINDSLTA